MNNYKKFYKLILAIPLTFFFLTLSFISVDGFFDLIQPSDVGIVLGSKVNTDGSLSNRLKARLDKAVQLYRQGYLKYIIVSGGLGREGHNEAIVMRKYLVASNIPESQLLVDDQGIDTWSSAKNCFAIINDKKFETVLIVTQFSYFENKTRL
ncbi:MAG: YdcF family protein [Bdellovibrionaceae bacterium]|nr:YdcF family protein [Pseudobdellovibrionaceae bacterium]